MSIKFKRLTSLLVSIAMISISASGTVLAQDISMDNTELELSVDMDSTSYSNPVDNPDHSVTWDCVWFGHYWQNDTNGDGKANQNDVKEPVKWRVLSVSGNELILLADQCLDGKPFNTEFVNTNWEKSTVRSWLNGYGSDQNDSEINYTSDNFIDSIFSNDEKQTILTSTLSNHSGQYPYYTYNYEGEDTNDKLFLLSYWEVKDKAYKLYTGTPYESKKQLSAKPTAFAEANGVEIYDAEGDKTDDFYGNVWWWLRSPGSGWDFAMDVSNISEWDCEPVNSIGGIRPVLRVSLSSFIFPAGTVCSDGTKKEIAPPNKPSLPEPAGIFNNPKRDTDNKVTYDCVWFGHYWQDNTNGDIYADTSDKKTAIKWRILSNTSEDLFLIADKCLDAIPYNIEEEDITWEESTVRSWLNGYDAQANKDGIDYSKDNFINNAFSASEQKAIKVSDVANDASQRGYDIKTNGGNDTKDRLFLLSCKEVITEEYGFSYDINGKDGARFAKPTPFSMGRGVAPAMLNNDETDGNATWWLRSPGLYTYNAADVQNNGMCNYRGLKVTRTSLGVRPAMHISPSSPLITYAGTVCSDGTMDEKNSQNGDDPKSNLDLVLLQKIDIADILGKYFDRYSVEPKGAAVISKNILTAKKVGENIIITGVSSNGGVTSTETAMINIEKPSPIQKTITKTILRETFDAKDNLTGSSVIPTTWVSSKPAVADVDQTGRVTVLGKGSVKLTAFYGEGKQAAKYSYTVKCNIPVMSKKTMNLLTGQTATLKLNNTKQSPEWRTSDDSILTVSPTNISTKETLTALTAGKATVSAQVEGADYECVVTVKEPVIKKKALKVKVGKTVTVGLKNTKLKSKDIVWHSEDEKIATVDENGKVRGISTGDTIIYTDAGGVRNTCTITVFQ